MFGSPAPFRQRIQALVEKFREKGATSPEKAMTAQELGLPPRFEQAMHRRLGATGIFVDVGGKYYLDEGRLQQAEQRWTSGGGSGGYRQDRSNMVALRIVRMTVGLSAIVLVLVNIFLIESLYLRLLVLVLVVVWIALTVAQIIYLSRMRRGGGQSTSQGSG